jgi:hypothetical protein
MISRAEVSLSLSKMRSKTTGYAQVKGQCGREPCYPTGRLAASKSDEPGDSRWLPEDELFTLGTETKEENPTQTTFLAPFVEENTRLSFFAENRHSKIQQEKVSRLIEERRTRESFDRNQCATLTKEIDKKSPFWSKQESLFFGSFTFQTHGLGCSIRLCFFRNPSDKCSTLFEKNPCRHLSKSWPFRWNNFEVERNSWAISPNEQRGNCSSENSIILSLFSPFEKTYSTQFQTDSRV